MKKDFKIFTENGIKTVNGHLYKGWGLDKRGNWIITHLKSGRKVHVAFNYLAKAKEFIDEIGDMEDWHNLDELVNIQAQRSGVSKKLTAIAIDNYGANWNTESKMFVVL